MKTLIPLVLLQLRNHINFDFLGNPKKLFFKLVLGLAVFGLYIYALMLVLKTLVQVNIITLSNRIPENFIVLIFAVTFVLFSFSTIIRLTNGLYFSDDNRILLTFPVKANLTFLSKLIVYYILELLRNLAFVVPVFIAIGIVNHYGFGYYLMVVVGYLFISALPITAGALISMLAFYITIFLRNKHIVLFVIYAIITGIVVYYTFLLVSFIPNDFNLIEGFATYFWDIQDFFNYFYKEFSLFTKLTMILIGESTSYSQIPVTWNTFTYLLGLIGVNIACVLLSFFVSLPLYSKMAASPYEYKKRFVKRGKANKVSSPFISYIKKEIVSLLNTPAHFLQRFSILVVLPLILFAQNKFFSSMDTRLAGKNLIQAFNVLLMLIVILAFNTKAASTFSSEGKVYYLLQISPTKISKIILAKISFNLVVTLAAIAVTSRIFTYYNKLPAGLTVIVFLSMAFVFLAHLLWSIELDMENPKFENYVDGASNITNPNETISTILAIALPIFMFFMSLLILNDYMPNPWLKILAVSAVLFIFRLGIFLYKAKIYLSAKDVLDENILKAGDAYE